MLTRLLARVIVTALALALAAQLFDGIWFEGPRQGQAELEEKLLPLLLVAVIASAVTAWIKPVLTLLSIPFILLTLGLFLFVLNALLLLFTAWLSEQLDIGFHVDGFWTAVGGAIVIGLTTWVLDAVFGLDDEPRPQRRAATSSRDGGR